MIDVTRAVLPAVIAAALAAMPAAAPADTIFFRNGARLDIGEAWVDAGQVKCRMYGEVVGYPLKDVLRVEKNEPPAAPTAASPVRTPAEIRRDLDILTLHNSAIGLASAGKTEEALAKEKQAYALDPRNDAVRATLGSLYNELGVERKKRNDFEGAVQMLKTALDYAPGEPQIGKNLAVLYVEMARQALDRNDFRQGRAFLALASEQDPRNARIYALAGRIAYLENDYAGAEQNWRHALQLEPQLRDVREQLDRLGREKSLESGFETRERDNFVIKFEGARNREFADSLMQALRDAYREVGRDFDLYPDSPVPVIVYPQADLGQLDYFPDWAAGTYDGKIRCGENIRTKGGQMKSVLYHEYAHVLVRMATGGNAPFWLNEGLAEYEARQFKTPGMIGGRERLLRTSARLFPLSELSGMPVSVLSKLAPRAVELAYAQSESFVRWLIDRYSFRDMRSLLELLGKGEKIEAAVQRSLNEDLASLEQQWREQVLAAKQ